MQRGAALIDVLIAITIVAMGVLSLSQASVHINAVRKSCEERELAEFAIDREVEVLRQVQFDTLLARDGSGFDIPVDVDGDGRNDPSLLAVASLDPDLVQVRLTVSWAGADGTRAARRMVWITNRRGMGGA
jgi:hypothetical protein